MQRRRRNAARVVSGLAHLRRETGQELIAEPQAQGTVDGPGAVEHAVLSLDPNTLKTGRIASAFLHTAVRIGSAII